LEAKPDQPHGSVFRGCKMDRASIVGAVAALEEHLARDQSEVFKEAQMKIERLKEAWGNIQGVEFEVYDVGTIQGDPGRVSLHLVLDRTPEHVSAIVRELMAGEPSVWTSAQGNRLVVNITSFMGLMLADASDTPVIAEKISEALR